MTHRQTTVSIPQSPGDIEGVTESMRYRYMFEI